MTLTSIFVQLLKSQGLMQHAVDLTHIGGHTLDVLITRAELKPTPLLVEKLSMSDHVFITADFDVRVDNGRPVVSVVERRRWRVLDVNGFSADLAASKLIVDPPVDVTELFACYDEMLQLLVDKHAPMVKITSRFNPTAPWCDGGSCAAVRWRQLCRGMMDAVAPLYDGGCRSVVR